MSTVYFNPGCALSLYKPELERFYFELVQSLYKGVLLHKVCCRHDPAVPPGSLIINVCPGCDRRFSNLYEGVSTISLWEVVDGMEHFDFPDYTGLSLSVHDACPVRAKPVVHQAVRSLLGKMGINIMETKNHGSNSVCCGDSNYPKHPIEQVRQKMRERADAMPCDEVCVYCVSCIKSMHIGGKRPRYLPDLLAGQTTDPQDSDTVAWHDRLQIYIDAH